MNHNSGSRKRMASAKRILLWVTIDTHYREMIRIARLLKVRTPHEPIILFASRYLGNIEVFEKDLAGCRAEGIALEDLTKAKEDAAQQSSLSPAMKPHAWTWARALGRLPLRICRRAVNAVRWRARASVRFLFGKWLPETRRSSLFAHYGQQMSEARAIIGRLQPDLLILPEDNVEFPTAALIKAAHEVHVPSIVVPFTLANAGEPAEAYFDNTRHHLTNWNNRRAAKQHAHWVYRHRNRDLLRLTAEHVWGQEHFGLAPPRPWILNSGYADVIALESEAVYRYSLRAGLSGQQLRVTGSLRQDEMAQTLRHAARERSLLLQGLGLPEGRPIVLCAWPPDQRPHHRPGCEFRTYPEIVEFWARSLGSLSGCNVVVNLHPRLAYENFKYIEQWGVHIARGDVARLIPLCDLYVACVSATICLAIACGKPVLNYDCYRFGYDDFNAASAVLTVSRKEEFLRALRQISGSLPEVPKDEQVAWGVLDGGAANRLLQLFDELMNKRTAHGAAA